MINVNVKGLQEIGDSFDMLSLAAQGKAASKALRQGADPMLKLARSKAPRDTGRLSRNVYKFKLRHPSADVGYGIGVRNSRSKPKDAKDNAWYWHFQEFGTAKMAAKPFLRPALSVAPQAIELTKTALIQAIIEAYEQ